MATALFPELPEPEHPFNIWEAALEAARRGADEFRCVRAHPRANVLLEMVRLVTGVGAAQCREYIRERVALRSVTPARARPKVVLSQALTGSWTGSEPWSSSDARAMAALIAELTDARVIVQHEDTLVYTGHPDARPVLLWAVKGWFARLDPNRDIARQVLVVTHKK